MVPGNSSGGNSIIWRYAEVLLNYAEAQNEAVGPDESVYKAMKEIRLRAGLPELPDNLDQAQMRARIRRERRVELAFEGKRFSDIRRWKTAEDIFKNPLRAMKITVVNGQPVYEKVDAGGGQITFDPSRNYLMPIPASVIAQNPKIKQNPHYDD